MIEDLALAGVVLSAFYFIALAAASLLVPAQVNRFLRGFAGTPFKHYTELFLRILVGGAFILHAPRMLLSGAFNFFGWVLIVTTACILLNPWRWHHRFVQHAVPWAMRYMMLVGLSSLALGGLILGAVILGSTD